MLKVMEKGDRLQVAAEKIEPDGRLKEALSEEQQRLVAEADALYEIERHAEPNPAFQTERWRKKGEGIFGLPTS